jgi:hypothetical protein
MQFDFSIQVLVRYYVDGARCVQPAAGVSMRYFV